MKKIIVLSAILLAGCNDMMDLYLGSQLPLDLYDSEEWGNLETERQIGDWIRENIKYEWDYTNHNQGPEETLKRGKGDCEDFAILFMCIAYFELGERYSLAYLDTGRAVESGGWVTHAVVSKDGRHFDPIWREEFRDVGYIYSFKEVFGR